MSIQSEVARISGEVSNQTDLMDQIQASLDNKADSTASSGEIPQTATPIEQNTARLQYILDTVNTIPDNGHTHTVSDITDLTVTATELNYMAGVTSSVQEQLNTQNQKVEAYMELTDDFNADIAALYNDKLNKSGGNVTGHIYLTGAKENSSTSNTSQIVFGTSSNNHVAISSNTNALVINQDTTKTTNQIVLYLDKASLFPSGISANVTGNLTGTASKATADASGNNIATTYETKSNATAKYNAISEWQSGAANLMNEHTNSINSLISDVNSLSSTAGIPSYVKTEAESVINKVLDAQGGRTFTFAAITDLHYGNGSYTDGVQHACQAMKYIDERIKLDAVAVLGDYTDGYPASGLDNAIGDFKAVNSVLDKLRFATNLRQQGNHDYYADNFAKTHRFIQAYSEGVVWGDKLGGYYYKDFEEYKLRIISLNTVEEGNSNIACSTAQYHWLISSLDLTAKDDAAEWQILILSHHPLDWYTTDEVYRFCYILDAYKKGASWSGGGISCNFAGKNAAVLIGNIHGHIHNLLTGYINKGNINTSNPTDVLRMCTPEACVDRANQYTGGWADTATYNKTKNTADDTSFCVYCIDLDSHTIKAICYGAGYDREVNYISAKKTYSIAYNLTRATSSNDAASVVEGESFSTKLTAANGFSSVSVTMGGTNVTSTAWNASTQTVTIGSVTGNIVITAVGNEASTSYTNQIPISKNSSGGLYSSTGYKTNTRLNSSGAEAEHTGWETTGFIPITQDSIVRFANIDWNSDGGGKDYLAVYDSSFNKIGSQQIVSTWIPNYSNMPAGMVTLDGNGNLTYLNMKVLVTGNFANGGQANLANMKYFRISACDITDGSIITVDEPIT